MNYRKNQRIHSDKLGGSIPAGWYLIQAIYETLQVLMVQNEKTGTVYTVIAAEE